MKNTILLKEGKNYAELALYFPEMEELQKLIDPEDLSPKGFETDAHVTLLYGFDDSVIPEDVQKILDKVKISSLKTDKISYFPDFGSGEPLKFDIIDPEIMNLNKLLQALPHPSTTHEYRPHVTIAYLKAGSAKKYVEDPRFNSLTFDLKPKEAKYSKNKVKTKLNLNEQSNTLVMNDILQNWNNFLNEQTEPYQRKMKAGHSRKKKEL